MKCHEQICRVQGIMAEAEKESGGKSWNKTKAITIPFSLNPADFCCQSLSSLLLVLEPKVRSKYCSPQDSKKHERGKPQKPHFDDPAGKH